MKLRIVQMKLILTEKLKNASVPFVQIPSGVSQSVKLDACIHSILEGKGICKICEIRS